MTVTGPKPHYVLAQFAPVRSLVGASACSYGTTFYRAPLRATSLGRFLNEMVIVFQDTLVKLESTTFR